MDIADDYGWIPLTNGEPLRGLDGESLWQIVGVLLPAESAENKNSDVAPEKLEIEEEEVEKQTQSEAENNSQSLSGDAPPDIPNDTANMKEELLPDCATTSDSTEHIKSRELGHSNSEGSPSASVNPRFYQKQALKPSFRSLTQWSSLEESDIVDAIANNSNSNEESPQYQWSILEQSDTADTIADNMNDGERENHGCQWPRLEQNDTAGTIADSLNDNEWENYGCQWPSSEQNETDNAIANSTNGGEEENLESQWTSFDQSHIMSTSFNNSNDNEGDHQEYDDPAEADDSDIKEETDSEPLGLKLIVEVLKDLVAKNKPLPSIPGAGSNLTIEDFTGSQSREVPLSTKSTDNPNLKKSKRRFVEVVEGSSSKKFKNGLFDSSVSSLETCQKTSKSKKKLRKERPSKVGHKGKLKTKKIKSPGPTQAVAEVDIEEHHINRASLKRGRSSNSTKNLVKCCKNASKTKSTLPKAESSRYHKHGASNVDQVRKCGTAKKKKEIDIKEIPSPERLKKGLLNISTKSLINPRKKALLPKREHQNKKSSRFGQKVNFGVNETEELQSSKEIEKFDIEGNHRYGRLSDRLLNTAAKSPTKPQEKTCAIQVRQKIDSVKCIPTVYFVEDDTEGADVETVTANKEENHSSDLLNEKLLNTSVKNKCLTVVNEKVSEFRNRQKVKAAKFGPKNNFVKYETEDVDVETVESTKRSKRYSVKIVDIDDIFSRDDSGNNVSYTEDILPLDGLVSSKTGKPVKESSNPGTTTSPIPGTASSVPGTTESSNIDKTTSPIPGTTESSNPSTITSPIPGITTSSNPGTTTSSVPATTESSNPGTTTSSFPATTESPNLATASLNHTATCSIPAFKSSNPGTISSVSATKTSLNHAATTNSNPAMTSSDFTTTTRSNPAMTATLNPASTSISVPATSTHLNPAMTTSSYCATATRSNPATTATSNSATTSRSIPATSTCSNPAMTTSSNLATISNRAMRTSTNLADRTIPSANPAWTTNFDPVRSSSSNPAMTANSNSGLKQDQIQTCKKFSPFSMDNLFDIKDTVNYTQNDAVQSNTNDADLADETEKSAKCKGYGNTCSPKKVVRSKYFFPTEKSTKCRKYVCPTPKNSFEQAKKWGISGDPSLEESNRHSSFQDPNNSLRACEVHFSSVEKDDSVSEVAIEENHSSVRPKKGLLKISTKSLINSSKRDWKPKREQQKAKSLRFAQKASLDPNEREGLRHSKKVEELNIEGNHRPERLNEKLYSSTARSLSKARQKVSEPKARQKGDLITSSQKAKLLVDETENVDFKAVKVDIEKYHSPERSNERLFNSAAKSLLQVVEKAAESKTVQQRVEPSNFNCDDEETEDVDVETVEVDGEENHSSESRNEESFSSTAKSLTELDENVSEFKVRQKVKPSKSSQMINLLEDETVNVETLEVNVEENHNCETLNYEVGKQQSNPTKKMAAIETEDSLPHLTQGAQTDVKKQHSPAKNSMKTFKETSRLVLRKAKRASEKQYASVLRRLELGPKTSSSYTVSEAKGKSTKFDTASPISSAESAERSKRYSVKIVDIYEMLYRDGPNNNVSYPEDILPFVDLVSYKQDKSVKDRRIKSKRKSESANKNPSSNCPKNISELCVDTSENEDRNSFGNDDNHKVIVKDIAGAPIVTGNLKSTKSDQNAQGNHSSKSQDIVYSHSLKNLNLSLMFDFSNNFNGKDSATLDILDSTCQTSAISQAQILESTLASACSLDLPSKKISVSGCKSLPSSFLYDAASSSCSTNSNSLTNADSNPLTTTNSYPSVITKSNSFPQKDQVVADILHFAEDSDKHVELSEISGSLPLEESNEYSYDEPDNSLDGCEVHFSSKKKDESDIEEIVRPSNGDYSQGTEASVMSEESNESRHAERTLELDKEGDSGGGEKTRISENCDGSLCIEETYDDLSCIEETQTGTTKKDDGFQCGEDSVGFESSYSSLPMQESVKSNENNACNSQSTDEAENISGSTLHGSNFPQEKFEKTFDFVKSKQSAPVSGKQDTADSRILQHREGKGNSDSQCSENDVQFKGKADAVYGEEVARSEENDESFCTDENSGYIHIKDACCTEERVSSYGSDLHSAEKIVSKSKENDGTCTSNISEDTSTSETISDNIIKDFNMSSNAESIQSTLLAEGHENGKETNELSRSGETLNFSEHLKNLPSTASDSGLSEPRPITKTKQNPLHNSRSAAGESVSFSCGKTTSKAGVPKTGTVENKSDEEFPIEKSVNSNTKVEIPSHEQVLVAFNPNPPEEVKKELSARENEISKSLLISSYDKVKRSRPNQEPSGSTVGNNTGHTSTVKPTSPYDLSETYMKAVRDSSIGKPKQKARRLKCEFCPSKFRRRADLVVHTRKHTGEKKFKCDICSKTFKTQEYMARHKKTHSGEKPYGCDTCGQTFSRNFDLKRHMLIHEGVRPYVCTVCDKAFTSSSDLTRHSKTHTEEKPFQCKTCKQAFIQKANLDTHCKEVHSEKKNFKCNICSKSFSRKSNLKMHMEIHTGGTEHKCDTCGKSFSQRGSLVRHSKIHTGERPFTCDLCGDSFNQNSHLLAHRRRHVQWRKKLARLKNAPAPIIERKSADVCQKLNFEEKTPSFPCKLCCKTFSKSRQLRKHRAWHRHSGIISCDVCKWVPSSDLDTVCVKMKPRVLLTPTSV
ncbi:zinc finger protein 267 [Elysia marginata]|uniref:Zinc finger protein 267 n=1 Tax=Elysia marginata TaxID=1093978 RepID=A0AAV4ESS6_9GAST|nr:zinc finger protein 267 [Elysia marginata]